MNPIPSTSGIYQIRNTANGRLYIGSAVNLKNRYVEHRCNLRGNRHHSIALQRAWNKHGEAAFEHMVLLFCAPKNLLMFEQLCIDGFRPKYNCCRIAGSRLGYKEKKPMSAEHREKISASKRGRKMPPVSDEYRAKMSALKKGFTLSAESRAKLSKAMRGRRPPPASAEGRVKMSIASKRRWEGRQRTLTLNGRTMPRADWARELGMKYHTLKERTEVYGWSDERALTTALKTVTVAGCHPNRKHLANGLCSPCYQRTRLAGCWFDLAAA